MYFHVEEYNSLSLENRTSFSVPCISALECEGGKSQTS